MCISKKSGWQVNNSLIIMLLPLQLKHLLPLFMLIVSGWMIDKLDVSHWIKFDIHQVT